MGKEKVISDFMEFYYGSTSSEFNQSRKQDFEVFVICSFDKILSYEILIFLSKQRINFLIAPLSVN